MALGCVIIVVVMAGRCVAAVRVAGSRSTDGSGQDISLEPISKAEFDRIRNTYVPLELDWKPVADYPLS